jgi:small multidrug resistance pump
VNLTRFRPWFYAAAVYNLVWGMTFVLTPGPVVRTLGVAHPDLTAWRVVGMLVLVYAPAYWWAARRPSQHAHLIAIATLGKVLGPLGFLWAAASGALPLRFGLTIVTNDLIWLPAFVAYLRAATRDLGLARFLLGERPQDSGGGESDVRLEPELGDHGRGGLHLVDAAAGVLRAPLDEPVDETLVRAGQHRDDLRTQPGLAAGEFGRGQALDNGGGEPLHEDAAQELSRGGVARNIAQHLDGHAEGSEDLGEPLGSSA